MLNWQSRLVKSSMRALADVLPACIAYIDADGYYCFANRTHQIWFGLEPAASEGTRLQDIFGASNVDVCGPQIERALQGECTQFELQTGDRTVNVVLTPDLDSDGTVLGCYALTAEIGELERATVEAQSTQTFLQAAIEALPIAISVKDVRPDGGGQYLLWNKASAELSGIPASHAIGRTAGQLFPAARVKVMAASETEALINQHPTEIQYDDVDNATSERRSLRIVNIPLSISTRQCQYLLCYTEDITQRLQAEMKQQEWEQRWENLIAATTDALLVIDGASSQICFHNPAAERLFGRSAAELADYEFGRVMPAARKEFTEIEILQPGGRFVFAQMRVANIEWEGKPALLASLTDVTERHAAEIALRRREANYRGLVDNLDAGVAVFAPDTSIMLCNAKTCELFGLSAAELLGKRIEDLSRHWCREDGAPLSPEDYPVNQVLQQRVPLRQFVFGISHEQGDRTWVLANAFPEFDQERQLQQVVVTFTDISTLKQAETRLRHAALHDSLTGLPNRILLVERLDRALKHARRHPEYWFAVLFIDLDRFKTINDSLGHQVGDLLLLEVARRLQAIVRANDTVCRLGGDEFVILLDGVCDAREVSYVAERIQESLQSLRQIDGCEIATSASIGIALSQDTYVHADEVLRDADTAMYRAKASGRACSEIFDRAMHEQVLNRFQLETSLRRAIERDEFLLHYQPIVSYQERQILGFEALVRWQHPERGYLSPSEFIPIAEETGLIVPLGAWVLETACRCMRDWQDRLPAEITANLKMGVNVSARQLQEGEFLTTIDRALMVTGLPPQCLNIEVTEGSLLSDVERTIDTLRALRQRRVNVSIDDFGTGYSSLSYLKRFPIDTLKIDRSFVDGLGTTAEDESIVKAIVTLAGTFGLGVVAEGVESELQLARVEALGCRAVQGNWFSEPVDARAAAALLMTCNLPARKTS
ncbi:MAG: EAL domain-containing protein [Cyanobacteria bacterium J06641_5]